MIKDRNQRTDESGKRKSGQGTVCPPDPHILENCFDRNYCVITIALTALKVLICSPVNTPGTILLERSFYSSEGEVPGTQVGKMHPTDPVKFIEY